jgi:hypothetical protein
MPNPFRPTTRTVDPRRVAASAIIAVVIVAALAGCGGSSPQTGPTTTDPAGRNRTTPTGTVPTKTATPSTTTPSTTTATTTSPTTTAPATSSTTVQGPTGPPADYPAAQPTPPSLAGAYPTGKTVDLVTVIKALTTYEDWLYSHPDPALVSGFMLTTGNDYASEIQNMTTLQGKGWHTDSTPTVVDWAKVESPATPEPGTIDGYQAFGGGLVTIVQDLAPGAYLNAAGQVVGHEPNGGLTAYSISLAQQAGGAQTPDGQFRILDVTQLHPPGGIAALEHQ